MIGIGKLSVGFGSRLNFDLVHCGKNYKNAIGIRTFQQSTVNSLFRKKNSVNPIEKSRASTVETHPIMRRIPRFMLPYTKNFINAPISHVTSFLLLHELTAIVPLIGIWYVFHKFQWAIPMDLPSWAIEKGTKIIDLSMAKFDFRDFSFQEKAKFIMEGAYAYVIVKGLFPFRLMFSLTFMPAFAKYFVIPFTNLFNFRRKQTKPKAQSAEQPAVTTTTPKKIDKPRL